MSSTDDRNADEIVTPKLFDLRTLIGALFVLYGVLLTVVGLFDSDAEIAKADGIRINLWLGLSMLLLGALFLLWVRLPPPRTRSGAGGVSRSDCRVGVLHQHPELGREPAAGRRRVRHRPGRGPGQ